MSSGSFFSIGIDDSFNTSDPEAFPLKITDIYGADVLDGRSSDGVFNVNTGTLLTFVRGSDPSSSSPYA